MAEAMIFAADEIEPEFESETEAPEITSDEEAPVEDEGVSIEVEGKSQSVEVPDDKVSKMERQIADLTNEILRLSAQPQ